MGSSQSRRAKPSLKTRAVAVIGLPLGAGQDHTTGVERGPTEIRNAGLSAVLSDLNYSVTDLGDVATESGTAANDVDGIKNSSLIAASLTSFYNRLITIPKDSFVLSLGGDHSLGSASIMADLRRHPDLRVIWVDAHGDCNTPGTSPSGNYHGMSAAHAMGWLHPFARSMHQGPYLSERRLVYIGLRDIDKKEKNLLNQANCLAFTMHDIDRLGIGTVMERTLKHLQADKHPVHLSFDIDAIDPLHAPGTGTLARGGLTYREAHFVCEAVAGCGTLVSMDMVEVNPEMDEKFLRSVSSATFEGMHGDMENIHTKLPTVRLALELIASALGKSIL